MMPASRATASTSPLATSPARMRSSVSGCITTRAPAIATRSVSSLSETSTIRARPSASRWVKLGPVARQAQQASRRGRTSAARISDSPTRKQRAPAAASRSRSSGRVRPLSPTTMRSRGHHRRQALGRPQIDFSVFRLRLLMPISRASSPARGRARRGRAPRPARRARVGGGCRQLGGRRVGERRHDQQDAVGAERAAFEDW